MHLNISVAGLGLVEGVVCFCDGHLCNHGMKQESNFVFFAFAIAIALSQ